MKELTIPIDQAGRIVLPKGVRQELAIQPGDSFIVSVQGLTITLTPNKEASGFVRKGKALVFITPGKASLDRETVNRLLAESRDERDNQSLAGLHERKRKG